MTQELKSIVLRFCKHPCDENYRAMRTAVGLDNKIDTTSGVIDLDEKEN